MATAILAPGISADRIPDPVTIEECALLFVETGEPEFTGRPLLTVKRKLQRWARQDKLPTEHRGQMMLVSYSDMLVAHAKRYPAPGR